LFVAGASLLSCSNDATDANTESWRCQDSADAPACTCYWATAETTLTMEVDECTTAISSGAKCCVFNANTDGVLCACHGFYDLGCPAESQQVSTCTDPQPR
jgi:hypothetical protein